MSKRNLKNTSEIEQCGRITGKVETPLGTALIITLDKSRGYTTNYTRKEFRYAKLPTGQIATITKSILEYWKQQGWEIDAL